MTPPKRKKRGLVAKLSPEEQRARHNMQVSRRMKRMRIRKRKARLADPERKKAVRRANAKRKNAATPLCVKRAKRAADGARAYDWEHLLPHIERRDDGHWIWHGPLRRVFGRVRPIVRAGHAGQEHVDFIVCCLAHGRPPTNRVVLKRLCDEVLCVAPDHLTWSSRTVERARRKQEGAGDVRQEEV